MKKFVAFWIIFLLSIISAEAKGPRKFYLTQGSFNGSQALTACAQDYHMASLWEIFDTTNLRYDTTLGQTEDDSGSGPPSSDAGWVRTGSRSSGTDGTGGVDNCFAWTSDNSDHYGTIVFLTSAWDLPPRDRIDPWRGPAIGCNANVRVWCVQD